MKREYYISSSRSFEAIVVWHRVSLILEKVFGMYSKRECFENSCIQRVILYENKLKPLKEHEGWEIERQNCYSRITQN